MLLDFHAVAFKAAFDGVATVLRDGELPRIKRAAWAQEANLRCLS